MHCMDWIVKVCAYVMSTNSQSHTAQTGEVFLDIVSQCIPQHTLRGRRSVPWLTDGIFISCLYNPSLVADYKRLRNRVVSALRDAKKSYFLQLNSGDYKQFWKTIEFLSKHTQSVPTLHYDGSSAVSDLEKCEMLNSFFSSSFNYSVASIPECSCGMLSSVSCPDGLLCTEDDVLRLIGSLDVGKASGPDGISCFLPVFLICPFVLLCFLIFGKSPPFLSLISREGGREGWREGGST